MLQNVKVYYPSACILGNKVPAFKGLNATLMVAVNHTTTIDFKSHVSDDHDPVDKLKVVIETNIPSTEYTFGKLFGPCREKTRLWGFGQSEIQTSLLSYKD